MKLISFSLWGDNPVYLMGALRNAELALEHYPDWICRFYCASDLDASIVEKLQNYPHVQVVLMPPAPDRMGAFWRFLASEDSLASHIIFRDTDSRLGERESAAVRDWLQSDWPFHLMRDHPFHWPPIMAGMWGCKGAMLTGWQQLLEEITPSHAYGSDQQVLADHIYPRIKQHCLVHDDFGLSEAGLTATRFPTLRQGLSFVGQSYNEHDQPNLYYEQELAKIRHL